jgi:hypothetical protein
MGSDLAEDFALLFSPFIHLPQKQVLWYFPIRLVCVRLVNEILELVVLSLEAVDYAIMIGLFILMALPGVPEPASRVGYPQY